MTEKEIQDLKDVKEAIDKIKKLRQMMRTPNRDGMMEALRDAKNKAPQEILTLEIAQPNNNWMFFEEFSDYDLYNKLSQYMKGLEIYCVNKIGKNLYDKLMNEELGV